jgi:hypothetical protein
MDTKDLTKRTIKKGKHHCKPKHKLDPRIRFGNKSKRGFVLEFVIPEEAWNDSGDESWLKMGGNSFFRLNSITPNTDAYLVAWRPKKGKPGYFELASYLNNKEGDWYAGWPIEVPAGTRVQVWMDKTHDNTVKFIYTMRNTKGLDRVDVFFKANDNRESVIPTIDFKSVSYRLLPEKFPKDKGVQFNISPYHGGRRVAPKSYHLFTKFKLYLQ